MVLRAHRDQTYPGAMVASLSIPWGDTRDDRAGYHLVWPRDLVACAGGLLALGAIDEAQDSLRFLIATQVADGYWQQNEWLGGTPYWTGIQLDEIAAPVVLAAALAERDALGGIAVADMARRALAFIARTGPASDQDRWEENAGINVYTLAFAIAALVAGAGFLRSGEAATALALADFWNANIERWTTVRDTPLARRLGVEGYFVRIAPAEVLLDRCSLHLLVRLKNQGWGHPAVAADAEVSTDFLQLVRFGLRSADDPNIRDSLIVVDTLLEVETPNGPAWRRYNGDGYGEHEDGSAFDGAGRGRPWPLLTGERGHYALSNGEDPLPYLEAMAAMAGPAGMLPEQVWDEAPIDAARLYPGHATGSAMPLAWAHAEFVKLALSREVGYPLDRPAAVQERYGGKRLQARSAFWFPHAPIRGMSAAASLVIALPEPALVHWALDDWSTPADTATSDIGLGLHAVTLEPDRLGGAKRVLFTWLWLDQGRWRGQDFSVTLERDEEHPGVTALG